MWFPTVANAVMGSVALAQAGVASGTNSMMRELGGVFGVAVLASVFARDGVHDSPQVVIDGFTQALWVGVDLSAVGAIAALLMSGRPAVDDAPEAVRPGVVRTRSPFRATDESALAPSSLRP